MYRWVVIITVVLTGVVGNVQGKYGGGTGEPNDPYQIWDANQMNAIGADANDWDKCFKLMADIDLSAYTGTQFNVIGYWNSPEDNAAFTGVFDGNGHTISNFTWHSTDKDDIGLFVWVNGGEIKNLGLIDPNVIGENAKWDIGALVGYLGLTDGGTVTNCYVEGGSVSGGTDDASLGGLVGWSDEGIISDCNSTGTVTGGADHTSLGRAGGLCGKNDGGTIIHCYSGGAVSGENNIGGLCGENNGGMISKCTSVAEVDGSIHTNTNGIGGLCGSNREGTIIDCNAAGSVTGGMRLGGLCGGNREGTIKSSYAIGNVSGRATAGGLSGMNTGLIINSNSTGNVIGNVQSGGLVGLNTKEIFGSFIGTVTDSYATGSVSGGEDSRFLGGLCGSNAGILSNCYATGYVIGDSNIGGLCGYQQLDHAQMTNCFWDTDTSGMSIGYNLDSSEPGTVTNVLGKTTIKMQMQSTFNDVNWDFINVWNIGENQTYPYLRTVLPSDINKDRITNFLDIAILCEEWLIEK
jgi:hypothetical protein